MNLSKSTTAPDRKKHVGDEEFIFFSATFMFGFLKMIHFLVYCSVYSNLHYFHSKESIYFKEDIQNHASLKVDGNEKTGRLQL
jgi:hypothetical protein